MSNKINKHGVTGYLEIGDIVEVCNHIRKKEFSMYLVKKIEGNKAITDFRIFNRKIYHNKYVYEYGKKLNPYYNNTYIALKTQNNKDYAR